MSTTTRHDFEFQQTLSQIRIPLLGVVYMSDNYNKYYGPFEHGQEAYEWWTTQPSSVRINFQEIRNPYIIRTVNDFYLPKRHDNCPKEFDHTIREY